MSRNRTERLVNLVICLLSTRRFLTAAQIAATVPGYEHNPESPKEHEAFQRKFERDKSELRDLGVPLETGSASAFDTEPGYRIARPEYELPDVLLEPDEAAAVGIAGRLWQHAGLSSAASSGLLKLRAAGVEVDPQATLGVEPVVMVDPTFSPLTGAAGDRQAVTFSYRPPEADEAMRRRLQPWGVVCWRGRWYVVGHDLDRDAARCFRLSRIVGEVRRVGKPGAFEVPDGINLIDYVAQWSGPSEHSGRAVVRLRHGRAAGVRRWADDVTPGEEGDLATVRYSCAERLAGWLVGYGADVVVLDPPEVREAIVELLRRNAERHPAPALPPARLEALRANLPRPLGVNGAEQAWSREVR
ncbi:MAG: WYL domain-containing protein [Micromonosporaceae bacterium]|nr:WYL domain-containing protein [Micromonosporaceae bacterium]